MADFDPLKAMQEELAALGDVLVTMRQRENKAQETMSEAERELNAIRKLRGYCQIEIAQLHEKINALQRK